MTPQEKERADEQRARAGNEADVDWFRPSDLKQ